MHLDDHGSDADGSTAAAVPARDLASGLVFTDSAALKVKSLL